MGSLLVRNVDDELIAKLKLRAARNKRSAEAEHREILRQALGTKSGQSFKQIAAKVRAMTANRKHTPSEILLREGRISTETPRSGSDRRQRGGQMGGQRA